MKRAFDTDFTSYSISRPLEPLPRLSRPFGLCFESTTDRDALVFKGCNTVCVTIIMGSDIPSNHNQYLSCTALDC